MSHKDFSFISTVLTKYLLQKLVKKFCKASKLIFVIPRGVVKNVKTSGVVLKL